MYTLNSLIFMKMIVIQGCSREHKMGTEAWNLLNVRVAVTTYLSIIFVTLVNLSVLTHFRPMFPFYTP